jgi:hypothetical protein
MRSSAVQNSKEATLKSLACGQAEEQRQGVFSHNAAKFERFLKKACLTSGPFIETVPLGFGNDISRKQDVPPNGSNNKAAFSSRRDFFPERGRRFAPKDDRFILRVFGRRPETLFAGCIQTLDASFKRGPNRGPCARIAGRSRLAVRARLLN